MNINPYSPTETTPEVGRTWSLFAPTILGASAIALALLNHSSVNYVKATVVQPQQAHFVHALI